MKLCVRVKTCSVVPLTCSVKQGGDSNGCSRLPLFRIVIYDLSGRNCRPENLLVQNFWLKSSGQKKFGFESEF